MKLKRLSSVGCGMSFLSLYDLAAAIGAVDCHRKRHKGTASVRWRAPTAQLPMSGLQGEDGSWRWLFG